MKKYVISFLLVIGMAVSSLPSICSAEARWVWVKSTDYQTVEFDSETLHEADDGIYLWLKITFVDSPELEQARQKNQRWANKKNLGKDYSQFVSFFQYSYVRRDEYGNIYLKILGKTDMDSHNNVIYRDMNPPEKVEEKILPPDSNFEKIYNKSMEILKERAQKNDK